MRTAAAAPALHWPPKPIGLKKMVQLGCAVGPIKAQSLLPVAAAEAAAGCAANPVQAAALRRASSLVEERETAAAQTSIQKPVLVPSADVGAGEATGSAAVVALPLAKVVGTTWAGHHIS